MSLNDKRLKKIVDLLYFTVRGDATNNYTKGMIRIKEGEARRAIEKLCTLESVQKKTIVMAFMKSFGRVEGRNVRLACELLDKVIISMREGDGDKYLFEALIIWVTKYFVVDCKDEALVMLTYAYYTLNSDARDEMKRVIVNNESFDYKLWEDLKYDTFPTLFQKDDEKTRMILDIFIKIMDLKTWNFEALFRDGEDNVLFGLLLAKRGTLPSKKTQDELWVQGLDGGITKVPQLVYMGELRKSLEGDIALFFKRLDPKKVQEAMDQENRLVDIKGYLMKLAAISDNSIPKEIENVLAGEAESYYSSDSNDPDYSPTSPCYSPMGDEEMGVSGRRSLTETETRQHMLEWSKVDSGVKRQKVNSHHV